MARKIAAVFDTRREAEQVAGSLVNEGIEARDIRVADTATQREYEERSGRSGGGFWSWLFGGSDEEAWSSDVDYYNTGLGRGGAVLTVDADDDRTAARVQHLLEAHGGHVAGRGAAAGGERTASASAASAGARRAGDREEDTLPVVEEQLRVGKRAVTRGGVRIYTRVTERPVEQDVRLREERVNVERHAVDRPVTAGGDAFRERTIEVDETVEEPVVAKEARIIEEVVISKDVEERTAKVRDTVRRTDVEVDRGEGSRAQDGALERDFRTHCDQTFGREGLSYEQCAPAYRYGYTLGSDRQYAQGDWATAESETRRRWEERNPGTWERFRSAIHYAWDRARGERRAA